MTLAPASPVPVPGPGGCALAPRGPGAAPLVLPAVARYRVRVVFDLCDTLARAERCLRTHGEAAAAGEVAAAFSLLEGGLCEA